MPTAWIITNQRPTSGAPSPRLLRTAVPWHTEKRTNTLTGRVMMRMMMRRQLNTTHKDNRYVQSWLSASLCATLVNGQVILNGGWQCLSGVGFCSSTGMAIGTLPMGTRPGASQRIKVTSIDGSQGIVTATPDGKLTLTTSTTGGWFTVVTQGVSPSARTHARTTATPWHARTHARMAARTHGSTHRDARSPCRFVVRLSVRRSVGPCPSGCLSSLLLPPPDSFPSSAVVL